MRCIFDTIHDHSKLQYSLNCNNNIRLINSNIPYYYYTTAIGWISANTDKTHNVVLKKLAEESKKASVVCMS